MAGYDLRAIAALKRAQLLKDSVKKDDKSK